MSSENYLKEFFMVEVNEGSKMDPGFETTCTETNWLSHVGAFENHMKFAS